MNSRGDSLKLLGGARSSAAVVQVTTLLGDSVLAVHHLREGSSWRGRLVTWVMLLMGWGGAAVGLGQLIWGNQGLAFPLLLLGIGQGIYGVLRRQVEQGQRQFLVGEGSGVQLPLAARLLPVPCWPLVRLSERGPLLLLGGPMTGRVLCDGRWQQLQQLAVGPQLAAVPFPVGSFAELTLGPATVLLESLPEVKALAGSGLTFDPRLNAAQGLSFAVHATVLALVLAIPPNPKALSRDLFDADNSKVRYLIKPPQQQSDEHRWLTRQRPDGSAAAGPRAKGREGTVGSPSARQRGQALRIKGPSENRELKLSRAALAQAVQGEGLLGVLNSSAGSPLSSLLDHDRVLGWDTETALGALQGPSSCAETGTCYGSGGLGLSGPGRGGGGVDGWIPAGSLNTIGPGRDPGSGPGGWGTGRLPPRKPRHALPPEPQGVVAVKGSLDRAIIRRVIRTHLNEVRFCYQKELQGQPELGGRVVVQFMIAPTGQVASSAVSRSTMNSAKVEGCVAQAVRRWQFPKPRDGGVVVVSYPFIFRSAGSK